MLILDELGYSLIVKKYFQKLNIEIKFSRLYMFQK